MRTLEIPGKGIFDIPSDWDELSVVQIKEILKLSMKMMVGQLDFDQFVVKAFYVISGIKRNWLSVFIEKKLSKRKLELKNANAYQCGELYADFLFKTPELDEEGNQKPWEFYYNTVVNYFPIIHASGVAFSGPKTYLQDLTFGEFRKAIDAMNVYAKSKDEASLDDFFVVLYRPDRTPLPEADLQALAKKASKVPMYIKMSVFLWFTTCVHYLTSSEVEINGRMLDFKMMFPKPEKDKKETGLGWTSLLFSMAKEGVFGDTDKTDSKQLYDVLMYMYDNHLQNLRAKTKTA